MKKKIGLSWYDKSQYMLLYSTSVDRADMAPTYEEWEELATISFEAWKKKGVLIEKVHIDVMELINWCKFNNRQLDGKARSEFCHQKLEEQSYLGV